MIDDKTKVQLCMEMIGDFYDSGLEGIGAPEAILNAVYTVLTFEGGTDNAPD